MERALQPKNKVKFILALSISVILLIIGLTANYYSDRYISKYFPNRPQADDYLFKHVQFKDLSTLNEYIMIFTYLLGVIFIIQNKYAHELPFYLLIMGVFSIFRAVFILMTPLANPYPNPAEFGLMHSLLAKNGMFPSGHTSVPFMFFLFSYYHKKWFYYISFLVLSILVATTMIISRGHYSIDIIATVFIVYSIYSFANKHLRWFVC